MAFEVASYNVLATAYLGRVSAPADQRTIVQLVEAAGLG